MKMAGNEEEPKSSAPGKKLSTSDHPTITLPPRNSVESFFNGGGGPWFSPGPMTLVSNFLTDNDECKSFSQLLAGAMLSPRPGGFMPESSGDGGGGGDFQFKQSRPPGLVVAQQPLFMIPPGLSPSGLFDSPGFFSPTQGPFGMSHQQALAQVTAQAAQTHPQMHVQPKYPPSFSSAPATSLTQFPSFTTNTTSNQKMETFLSDSRVLQKESSDFSHSDQTTQPTTFAVDKPADDGYNWRKYGQKQVKGSEFPRSYYKCTHPSCPVKKKVERSLDGQVTEIIYKGQHNHQRPQSKRSKDTGNLNGHANNQRNSEFASQFQYENSNKLKEGNPAYLSIKERESSHSLAEHQSGTSDSEEVGNTETGMDEKDDDEPEAKRRGTEARVSDPASSHRAVTDAKIIVQTTSEVDLLDDGYRWRKYGQKVVKGNPYPRSYYKCTTQGCNVRKHVERASTDPKAVITTYEGKHNHDIPAARSSSHSIANTNSSLLKPHAEKYAINKTDIGNNDQRTIGRLRLKEEQII